MKAQRSKKKTCRHERVELFIGRIAKKTATSKPNRSYLIKMWAVSKDVSRYDRVQALQDALQLCDVFEETLRDICLFVEKEKNIYRSGIIVRKLVDTIFLKFSPFCFRQALLINILITLSIAVLLRCAKAYSAKYQIPAMIIYKITIFVEISSMRLLNDNLHIVRQPYRRALLLCRIYPPLPPYPMLV